MVVLKKTAVLFLLIIISLVGIKPLAIAGYFPMHDDTQPTRIYGMANALSAGQFPVRWVADLGYGFGYPIFNFYSPLPYYTGAILLLLGIQLIAVTKLTFALGFLLSGISMYALTNEIFGKRIAFLCSLLYVFAPYHAVQLYVRGAMGELWAYGLLPLVFYGIILIRRKELIGIMVGSIALAALILSHNITALLVGFVLSIWFVMLVLSHFFYKKNNKHLVSFLWIIFLGIGLSAFFWLPALVESSATRIFTLTQGTNDFHNHFVFLDQLWSSPWGFAGSAPGRVDGMSFMIGKMHVVLLLLAVISIVASFLFMRKKQLLVGGISLVGLLVSIFMLLSVSTAIWELVPYLAFTQYPWRLLLFVVFFISLIIGNGFFVYAKSNRRIVTIAVTLLSLTIVLFNQRYFQPQFIRAVSDQDYISQHASRFTISKISDEYLPRNFPIPDNVTQIAGESFTAGGDIMITSSEVRPHRIHLRVQVLETSEVSFALAYFPGWRFFVDGLVVKPQIRDGKPVLSIDSGEHWVTAYFSNTWVRIVGNILSFLTLITICTIVFAEMRKKTHLYEKK
ncbi:hypothetical protein C4564_02195 [Candidatus Microgenomates bacterium]|nr:MAG: hypothetical protein C4564_02195 [Candidatus Microgenomates bacterium]